MCIRVCNAQGVVCIGCGHQVLDEQIHDEVAQHGDEENDQDGDGIRMCYEDDLIDRYISCIFIP